MLVADEAAARILREAGYRVSQVLDGQDLLARLATERPEAIILGDPDVCRTVKKRTAGDLVPVLLIANGSPIAGFKAGADDVICRPLEAEELCARVDVWLRTRRMVAGAQARRSPVTEDAGRDPLTGLPDGRAFTQRLSDEFDRAQREHESVSVMAVDLDALGDVNGRFGRTAGDRLLVAAAKAVVRACRQTDYVARSGGDEMVAMLADVHFSGCVMLAEKVWREIGAVSVDEAGGRLGCEASVGIASYPSRDIENPKDLLRYAHAALARAKAEGHGRICLYQHQGYLYQPQT